MVSLFKACWPEISDGKMSETRQNENNATIHYRNDVEGILEKLPNGWDTKIKDI